MRYVVVGGLATEEVSGELLICDGSGAAIHRLSGDARRYFEQVLDGETELPADDVTAALVTAKVIAPSLTVAEGIAAEVPAPSVTPVDMVSRRRAMVLGATAVAAAGVVTVGLPSAAMAASPDNPADYPAEPDSGTAPVDGSVFNATTFILTSGTSRQTSFLWYNDDSFSQPVTYSYFLYSPASSSTPVANGTGTATGQSPIISVPNAAGETFLWLVTSVGGTREFVSSTFPG